MKFENMEINMNFLDMLDESLHPNALKEINFNETKEYEKHLPMETVLPEFPGKVTCPSEGVMPANKKLRTQRCAHEGCNEVAYKARASRNWVCKSHQAKMNKEMLKRRLEERCRTPAGDQVGIVRKKQAIPGRPGGGEKPGSAGLPNQFRSSLLEEILNEKKITLMRSPEVVAFLKAKQKKIEERKRLELQLKREPMDAVSSSSSAAGQLARGHSSSD